MKLQRYRIRRDGVIEAVDTGGWLQWPDVDDLLTRIRAAVEAEREAVAEEADVRRGAGAHRSLTGLLGNARAALDALLSGEG